MKFRYSTILVPVLLATTLAMVVPAAGAGDNKQTTERQPAKTLSQSAKQEWKAGLLEGAYLFNTHLNNFKIGVDVEGTTAILTGTVKSPVQRSLAEEIALSIDGINDVNNRLELDTDIQSAGAKPEADAADGESTGAKLTETFSDATITAKVKSRLIANRQTSGWAIDVDTKHGVVSLTGKVESETEKELVYYIARNTNGVASVINNVEVAPDSRTAAVD